MANVSTPMATGAPNQTMAPSFFDHSMSLFASNIELLLLVLYTVVTVAGLIMNGIICYLFLSRRVKKSPFHEYLLSLTISDMITLLSCYPYIFVDVHKYHFNEETYRIVCSFTDGLTLFWMATGASVAILSLISLNRYLLVNYPKKFSKLRGTFFVRSSVIFAWAFSVLLLLPNAFSYRFYHETGICVRDWPKNFNGTIYSLFSSILGIGVPLGCMILTLFGTIRTLWFKQKLTIKNSAVVRGRKRVIIMLIVLTLTFMICYFPFVVYWLLATLSTVFKKGVEGHYEKHKVLRIVILFVVMNSVLDPVIYGFRSFEIKRALKALFKKEKDFIMKSIYSRSDYDSRESRYRTMRNNIIIVNTTAVTATTF